MATKGAIVASGKMTQSEYRMLHFWVEKKLGKPQRCDECGTTEKRRYHWANISQEYKRELSDWRRLCARCHSLEKHPGKCVNGHELSPDNLVHYKDKFRLECRTCRRQWSRKYYWRDKAKQQEAPHDQRQ